MSQYCTTKGFAVRARLEKGRSLKLRPFCFSSRTRQTSPTIPPRPLRSSSALSAISPLLDRLNSWTPFTATEAGKGNLLAHFSSRAARWEGAVAFRPLNQPPRRKGLQPRAFAMLDAPPISHEGKQKGAAEAAPFLHQSTKTPTAPQAASSEAGSPASSPARTCCWSVTTSAR